MEYLYEYDRANPKSIEEYARKLIGHTFNDVKEWNLHSEVREDMLYDDKSRKGGLGNFMRKSFSDIRPTATHRRIFRRRE